MAGLLHPISPAQRRKTSRKTMMNNKAKKLAERLIKLSGRKS